MDDRAVASANATGGDAPDALWRLSPNVPTHVRLLIVFLACFASSRLMLHARFTEAGPAVLFPPYAILTAALLFSSPHRWWMYLLTVSAASFVPHRMLSPTPYVLATEIANYTKVGIAAAGVRRFAWDHTRLDALRSMFAFLVFAVVLGPLSAAFIGAAVAVLFHGASDYWLVWRGWFFSNAVTALTLLPLIVTGIRRVRAGIVGWPFARTVEAAAMLALLLGVAIYVFAGSGSTANLSARFYAPLPLLVWAAVRFGIGGTSACVLVLRSVTIWGATHGRGPFIDGSPTENLLELQLFIIAVSLPLMLLAAVVEERHNKETALRESEADLRRSYAQVQSLVARLMTAQEDERSFIARELHDDIGQQVVALSMGIGNLGDQVPARAVHMHAEIARQQARAVAAANAIRRLSHGLHPGTLQYVGLVEALKHHCREFSDQHAIDVTLSAEAGLERIPPDITLCLYRVAQEALRNVASHASARHASVVLRQLDDTVEMTIADDGEGMGRDDGVHSAGLGLISLDERVRMVRGTIRIRSSDSVGTELFVQVPLRN